MPDKQFSRLGKSAGERKKGEAPSLGKLPRTPRHGLNRQGDKHTRTRKRKKHSPFVIAWTLLLAFVALSLLAVISVSHYRHLAARNANTAAPPATTTDWDLAFQESHPIKQPELAEAAALEIVRAALANRDPGLVRDHFILDAVAEPADAIESLERIKALEGDVTSTEWLGHKHCNGRFIAEVVVSMSAGERPTNRLAQLLQGADGKWRIYLDSFLRKTTPDWEKIMSDPSVSSLVRVFIANDNYYNGSFSDESVWKAYALASPDQENILYAYAKRNSPQQRAMDRIIASEEDFHRATLAIRGNPGDSNRQFEIERVIAENWVIGERDFDTAF